MRITYTAFDYMGRDKGGRGGVIIQTASILGELYNKDKGGRGGVIIQAACILGELQRQRRCDYTKYIYFM